MLYDQLISERIYLVYNIDANFINSGVRLLTTQNNRLHRRKKLVQHVILHLRKCEGKADIVLIKNRRIIYLFDELKIECSTLWSNSPAMDIYKSQIFENTEFVQFKLINRHSFAISRVIAMNLVLE